MMTAMTASSSALQSLESLSQPDSKGSSPASPTSTFQNLQPLPPRFLKTPIRGQSSPFPSTPTADRSNMFDSPPGMAYSEFIRTWTDNHVAHWLADIKCGNHASTFKANDIRGDVLLELDQVTLKEMGISSIGDRLRIVNAVKNLRQKCSTRSTSAFSFEPARPRVYVSGESEDGRWPASSVESGHHRSGSSTDLSSSSRLARRLENGRPPPLHLGSNNRSDLPRLVREGSGSSSAGNGRLLPLPSSASTPNSGSNRANLPLPLPAPRTQPPPPPSGRPIPARLQPVSATPQRTRTPTAEVPAYAHSPLPPAPGGQNMLTPTSSSSQNGNWSSPNTGYGLPADPRPGKASPFPSRSINRSPNPNAAHNRNMSFAGVNSPLATVPGSKNRPSTGNSSHPYASDSVRSQALQAPTPQQIQAALSPIAESFISGRGGGMPSPPTPFGVPRGAVTKPTEPQHAAAPSLDDLRRKLVRFMLPDEGHSCTINAEDCAGGIEVLEKVLKKFGKLGSRGDASDIMELVETADGGLSVDGWGVYIDWGQGDGVGKPLTEGELLSICHAPPDNPARERGLTLRRSKGKRSKVAQFFGEGPPLLRAHSPTSPPVLPTGDLDRDGNLLSPKSMLSFEEKQKPINTKRASSISILSGLGVAHPEKALDPPLSPTKGSDRNSPATWKRPSKLRNFFGQRPPSELITTHLAEYFPFTEKKVLERTARHSMMRVSTMSSLGRRDSTISWNPAPPLPSRFSSSTQGDRSSFYASQPLSDKVSIFTGETTPTTEEPPRMSLSTEDGRSMDLSVEELEPPRMNSAPQLLPPVNISAESFSESMEKLTSGRQRSRPVSMALSMNSKRMSYMTELRSKRDISDTASLMTVDEITASVESRRDSIAVDIGAETDEWTKVGSDEGDETVVESTEQPEEVIDEDESEESPVDGELSDEDETGKAVQSAGGKWIKGALIGAGSFGKVYLGMDASNGLLMAVKQVELPTGSSANEERKKSMLSALEREIDLLKDLQHENIVQYLYSSLDDDYLNIFLEYVPGGSVTALLRNYGAFEEQLVKNFVRQILQGLDYLHERDIIHRDIKGANILVDNKGGIKISDFGISKKVEGNLLGKRMNRPSLQGSVFWMAPEVVKQKAHTRKADIWSVGCLVVEMLTGEHPWAQLTQMQAIFKIGSSAKPTIPSDITADAQDFLQKTFDLDYEARPDAGELLQHPWVTVKKASSSSKNNTLKMVPPTIEITA